MLCFCVNGHHRIVKGTFCTSVLSAVNQEAILKGYIDYLVIKN